MKSKLDDLPEFATTRRICARCVGEGSILHPTCGGRGYTEKVTGNYGSENFCRDWILEHVSEKARKALSFCKFYYDGSVDSEMTFTLPVEDGKYIVEFIQAFKDLSEATGQGIDVAGAGMHIAVLVDGCGGKYPVTGASLDNGKLNNFANEVAKLLPAMYLLASSGKQSRKLYYREAQISNQKYSAIHVLNGALEFRLFETCYDRPTAVIEFLGVIDKALEFYADPSKKVEKQDVTFPIFEGKTTRRFVRTSDQIRVIRKQFALIKPEGLTIKEIETTRNVKITIAEVKKKESLQVKELKKLFKEHISSFELAVDGPLTRAEEGRLQNLRAQARLTGGHYSDKQLKAMAMGLRVPELDEKKYIENNKPAIVGRISKRLAV